MPLAKVRVSWRFPSNSLSAILQVMEVMGCAAGTPVLLCKAELTVLASKRRHEVQKCLSRVQGRTPPKVLVVDRQGIKERFLAVLDAGIATTGRCQRSLVCLSWSGCFKIGSRKAKKRDKSRETTREANMSTGNE
jgi:hypothetical protein